MPKLSQSYSFNVIVAETTDGKEVSVYVAHSERFLAERFVPPHPVKKTISSIKDVSGSADGANSEVTLKWQYSLTDGQTEKVRVKETPAELVKIFAEAGAPKPLLEKSMSVLLRDLKNSFFGHQPV